MTALGGVAMEIEDLAYPLVHGVVATDDAAQAFQGVDYAVFLGAFPRKAGMERKDLLTKNVGIFKGQGEALGKYGKPTCKVVVVGNPANTNCLTLMHYAPNIPKENFSALTRLDHNRARSSIALKLGVNVKDVSGVCIWGNHSSTQYPDLHHALVSGKAALEQVDSTWYTDEFIPKVQKRGAAVIAARGLSSAASAAKATADHVHDWVLGSDGVVSMAVISDGNSYGVPSGLIYSFPVICSNGSWKVVDGLAVNDFSRGKMDATAKELQEESAEAQEILASA
jgi:malate dehydrogenase